MFCRSVSCLHLKKSAAPPEMLLYLFKTSFLFVCTLKIAAHSIDGSTRTLINDEEFPSYKPQLHQPPQPDHHQLKDEIPRYLVSTTDKYEPISEDLQFAEVKDNERRQLLTVRRFSSIMTNIRKTETSFNKNNSIHVTGIKCFISANEGMYSATLNGNFPSIPVIEDGITTNECTLGCNSERTRCELDLQSKDIANCGVQKCGIDTKVMLCVTLRVPTVPRIVLPEDVTIVLQCHPQATVITQTKQIRVTPKEITGRMANVGTRVVATNSGDWKAHFNSQIALYRHGTSGFTRKVASGDFIVLGEELLLQSSVDSGDGWKYIRVSDVAVHRYVTIQLKKSLVDSVTLVDANGCRNPNMISISPWHPTVDPQNDLLVTFLFRAFMFNNMKEGDELVISVQILACVLRHHCSLNTNLCDQNDVKGNYRIKRNSIINATTGWTEDLTFRISFGERDTRGLVNRKTKNGWITLGIIFAGIFILLTAYLVVYVFLYHFSS